MLISSGFTLLLLRECFLLSVLCLLTLFIFRCVPVGNVDGILLIGPWTLDNHNLFGKEHRFAGFKRWKRWSSSNYVCCFPVNPFQVTVYLQCLINEANSPAPIFNAVYSIECAQQLAGLSKMSTHPLVSLMANASQRILGRPKVEKDSVTPKIVKSKITDKFLSFCLFLILDQSPMLNWLPGFFRFSELCHIKACEVKFFPLYVFIFLESSKTD